MKILQVIDRVEVGGAERVFLDLTKLLLDKGLQVDTLCISAKGKQYESIDARANKMFLNRKSKYSISTMWKCALICSGYDLVHVHMRHTYAYVRLAQIISQRKYKLIFHDHFNLNRVPNNLKGIFTPKYYIGVSSRIIKWAKTNLNTTPQNIFLLRNTIEPKPSFKISQTYLSNLVIVSNIKDIKNIEFSIQLAQALNTSLTIIGKCYDSDYFDRLKNMIGKDDRINFITSIDIVQEELSQYKIGLHTSPSETGPLALLEYLAQGLPFVAYQTGEVAHLLKDFLPQCFVNSFDRNDWLIAIEQIEQNPPDPEYLKELFHTHFGPENYIQQCLQIYQQVVSS